MWTAIAATCVTSSMFVTALAPNLLALEFARKTANVDISWTQWFVASHESAVQVFPSLHCAFAVQQPATEP